MTRFANVLKQIGDRLEVGEPARTRILLEVDADLEDCYQHYLNEGCDAAEAKRRAEDAFATSDETLRLLERIHRTGRGSSAYRFLCQLGALWSKILMVFLFLFEIFLAVQVFTTRSLFVYPSPFLWPIALLALAAFLFTVWKLVQIFSPSSSDARRLRTGLAVPLVFAGMSLAISGLGFLYHLQRFFRLNAEGAPEALFMNFAGWMVSISSLMTLGLLTAVLAALVWFVLSGLVIWSEAREVDALLQAGA